MEVWTHAYRKLDANVFNLGQMELEMCFKSNSYG